jgi:hypothetical protein
MTEHLILFKVALFPNDSNIMNCLFDNSLCSDDNSQHVLNKLHLWYAFSNRISNLKYLEQGIFSCNVILYDFISIYQVVDDIENLLWMPYDRNIEINNKTFYMDFKLYDEFEKNKKVRFKSFNNYEDDDEDDNN